MNINFVILSISMLVGVAMLALFLSFRHGVAERFNRDVAWLNSARRRINPNAPDSRGWVLWGYIIYLGVLLPLFHYAIPTPGMGIVIWLCLLLLPQKIADRYWQKHLEQIDAQLPQAIRKFANLCAAGLSPAETLRQLGEESPMPIQAEFREMSQQWQMGSDLPGVFQTAFERLHLESFRLLASAVTANTQLGGNLVATLERLSYSLFEQIETRKEIDAALAEGKMNIYGLLAAPPVMLIIIMFIDAKAVKGFFTSFMGLGIFAAAMLLIGGGAFWACRIAKIRV